MSRQSLLSVLCLALLVTGTLIPISLAADPGMPHKPGEVIIKFKTNANQAIKNQIRAEMGGTKIKGFGRIKAELNQISGLTVAEAVDRYKNHPKIEYIEPNYIWEAVEIPNDTRFDELWGMLNTGQTGGTPGADISATNAWDVFTGSSTTLIGVIDTGVDYTHPDLAANIWTNPGEIAGNNIDDDNNGYIDDIHGWDFINNDNDPMDDNGHGSHVSGTIGGVGNNGVGVAGVCWNVNIMALKFLSAGGSGSTADAVEAVEYATMMGVRLTSNSWGGGGFSQSLLDAINDADAAGILFVAASGNSGANTDVSAHYPSSYTSPNIVSVAATDHNDQLASFSNFGVVSVDLAAPGVDILSTFPGNSYGSISGTSMATPHVAGALGLVFGRFPAIGHLDAKNLLLNFVDPLPNLSGVVLTGGRLNAFFPIADPDSIPPDPITDLATTDAGSNWLVVDWTATGDDGNTGTASRYDVKYSTSPINAGNFDAATTATNPPDPGPSGTPESMQINGLDFTTTYFVAVKALDEFGNASDISNVASGTTLGIPDIAATPLSFTETLLTGATSTQSLTLSNVGLGTLDYDIPAPQLITNAPAMAEYTAYGKEGVDPRPGILGNGGPDGFGYRWVDSDDPTGPIFNWTDISGTGTLVFSSGDDVNNGPFPIGFTFQFYGVEYTDFNVCSNGWLSFTSTSTAYSNQPLPNSGAPAALLAPLWDDLNLNTSGEVYYETVGSSLIVQWNNVAHYGSGGPYTFQAILQDDGTIQYQYLTINAPDNSATIGIQNAAQTDGLQVVYNAAYVHDNLAIRIVAVPQWVTVSPTAGTIFAPGSEPFDVSFDASGLLGGTYDATILIFSNDPDENPFEIPVQLTVVGAPDIELAPALIDFGPVFIGATPVEILQVQNPGTDVLTVTSITVDDPSYSLSATAFTVPPQSAQDVQVTFAPTSPGMFPATVTVNSDDPDEPAATMSLTGQGLVPPDFSVSPTSLSSSLLTGETETQGLTLSNGGGADLEWSLDVQFVTAGAVIVHDSPELGKEDVDSRPGILGSGGPDTFGYSWIDSDEPGGPVFGWEDISGTGTPVFTSTGDDRNFGPFPIGFTFPLYGNDFTDFRVCSNGWVSFTSTSTDLSNDPLPASGAPENLLAAFWDDLVVDLSIGGNVYYEYDGQKLIIQYDNVRRFGSGGPYTFEIFLYPNGKIVYQYLSMAGTRLDEATIGIQNATRDDGLTVVYNANYVHDNLAVRISTTPEWLSASPTAGVVPPSGSVPISVTFDATGLFGGAYEANMVVTTNDPLAPEVTVPAALQVTGAPDLVLDPTSLDFGDVFVGYPDLHQVEISNAGTDLLTISSLTSDSPEFTWFLSGGSLPINLAPLTSTVVQVNFSPPAAGPFSGTMTIGSNDPGGPTLLAVTGNGLIAPVASATPTSLSSALFTGDSETQTVTLSNTGGSDLEFTIASQLSASVVVVHDSPELGKGDVDSRPGILGSGGPDTFGYSWIDSDEPGGPVFGWEDISGTGTPVFTSTGDDRNFGPFPIGFTFPLYGNDFTDFRVCSNGWVSFTSTSTDLSNDPLPASGAPENLLAAFWDDLVVDLSIGGNVYYEYDGQKLIIQYDNVRRFGSGGPYTFEIFLYPNGKIVYQYLSMAGTRLDEATIGIQNATRDDGLTVVYNADYVHDNLAVRIATTPDWLSASPTAGVVPPGGSVPISVTFDATGLFGGAYDGAVVISNNDPANGVIEIPAHLDVTGVPLIAFDPASLDFGNVFLGYPAGLTLTVTNAGTDLLSVADVSAGLPDYSVDATSFDLDPLESLDLTVTFDPQAVGDRGSMLTFMSNDAGSPHMVALAGVGVDPPVVATSPDTVVGAAMPGGSKTKTLTVCNDGDSDLIFSVSEAQDVTSATVYSELELPKQLDEAGSQEAIDPRPGILGAGGPDAFGYTWIDSDEPGGPVYDWVDISGTGTSTFNGYSDDGNRGPFPIGFDFPFYGNTFSEFRVCSNGWLSFTSTQTTYTNQPLPNSGSSVPENLLAVWWDDMVVDPTDGGEIYYEYDGSRLIIQYEVRRIATSGNPPFFSFEIILYPNGNVVYQYDGLGVNISSATIGIQNATRDDGLTVVHNDGSYPHENLAIQFSAAPDWLTVTPTAGVVPAGECVGIDVIMDASELEAGDYFGQVTVTSNDPATPVDVTPVVFHVGTVDAADSDVDPNTLNLGSNGRWITGYVELPMEYDPADVLIETVRFNEVVPADEQHYSIGDFNMNSWPDLKFKFDRSAVEDILPEGDSVVVCITGEIEDTIYFVAKDTIRVIQPQVNFPNGGETIGWGVPVEITWSNPAGWNVSHSTLVYSTDDGETWTLVAEQVQGESYTWTFPQDFTETALLRIYVYDPQGVLGYDTSDGVFTVAGGTSSAGEIPTVNALLQNAPNPFHGSTWIGLDLREESHVDLRIYDVAGRLVRVLEDGMLPAGAHVKTWNGTDDAGNLVTSGVYFYRAVAGSFVETRTMFLVK